MSIVMDEAIGRLPDDLQEVREQDVANIVYALNMAIAQIEMSMNDTTVVFARIQESISDLELQLNVLETQAGRRETELLDTDALDGYVAMVKPLMRKAMIALQFHDRLCQRVYHIEENLRAVTGVIQQPEANHPVLWRELREKMQSLYSDDQEKKIMGRVDQTFLHSENRLKKCDADATVHDEAGDIELF
ncbi:MAG TPA: hypothetical protein DD979_07695 [Gammaproteobacteria bacterium]|nr:hypothetical protein [Gammaproteobacteria bacterium]